MRFSPKALLEKWKFEGDTTIWVVFFFLCIISIIEVYSASSNMSYKSGNFWSPVIYHTVILGIGALTTYAIHLIPCRYFKLIPVFGLPLSVFLLLFVLFTGEVNDASRWIGIGGVSFQPSELAKGALITTVALLLATMRNEQGATQKAFKWIAIITAIICGLIVPENFSTAGIAFLSVFFLAFIGKVPWKPFAILLGTMIVGLSIGYSILRYTPMDTLIKLKDAPVVHRLPTWAARVQNNTAEPANPKDYDIKKANPQITHARIAIASSAIPKGPGNSVERDFLPQAYSDFIYAIICEELGFYGGAIVMAAYLLLLFRAMRIAGRCEKNFPAFLVMGLALMLVIQALVNMAVAVGAIPVTGQPLPLISKGGTSTIINCAYLGIMLSVSRSAKKRSDLLQEEPVETHPETVTL